MRSLVLVLGLTLAIGVGFAQEAEKPAEPESKVVTTESGLQY